MPKKDKISNRGGKREGAGRKSRKEKGLLPVVNTTIQVESEVIVKCRTKHGSLANALRYAAEK